MRKFYVLTLCVPGTPSRKLAGNGGFDVAGAIGSGLSFIGGLVTNSTNKKLAREQMRQQERLFNTQMDYTKAAEMRQYEYADKAWDREAAYNDPAAQKARFEAAGLNPALMMEGQNAAIGSAESVSAPSPPSPPSLQSYQVQDPITPAVQTYFQSRMLSAQARKTEEEANQVGIDNQTRVFKNISDLIEQRARINNIISDTSVNEKEKEHLSKVIEQIEEQLAFNFATLDARMKSITQGNYLQEEQINAIKEDIVSSQTRRRLDDIIAKSKIALDKAQIDSIHQSILESQARSKKEAAEEAKLIMEKNNIDPQTPEGSRFQRHLESQIYRNYIIQHSTGSNLDYEYYRQKNEIPPKIKRSFSR